MKKIFLFIWIVIIVFSTSVYAEQANELEVTEIELGGE
ncbi:MAG: hypothetical protein AWL62_2701, partial [Halanaerobium sp. T82-1]